MSNIQLGEQIRKVEGVDRWVDEVRERIQKRINLDKYTNNIQQVTLNTSILMRSCLLVGLSSKEPRAAQEITGLKIAPTSPRLLGVLNNNQTNAMIKFITCINKIFQSIKTGYNSTLVISNSPSI